jgi:hypothetical protein
MCCRCDSILRTEKSALVALKSGIPSRLSIDPKRLSESAAGAFVRGPLIRDRRPRAFARGSSGEDSVTSLPMSALISGAPPTLVRVISTPGLAPTGPTLGRPLHPTLGMVSATDSQKKDWL